MLRNDGLKNQVQWTVRLMILAALCWAAPSANAQASSYVPAIVTTSTMAVSASGLTSDLGDVALDACGDVYAINAGSGEVDEIPPGGGVATVVLGSGSYGSMSLAMDAAKANLYVLQGYQGSVTAIPISGCVPQTGAKSSIGVGDLGAISYYWGGSAVAADPSGNVFIATNGACCAAANELLEEYGGTAKYQSGATLIASMSNPITSMATDSNGDLFYVSGGALFELPVATAATSSAPAAYSATAVPFGNSYSSVVGVSFDGSGNLYIADAGASTIYEIPLETGSSGSALKPSDQFIVSTGVSLASAVAVAPAGNMFFANLGTSVYELTEGSANFGGVAVGGNGSATVNVVFNAAETPASIQFATSSTISSTGGTCAAGTAYTPGSSCTITAQFAPATPGAAIGGITLTGVGGTDLAKVYLAGTGMGAGLTMDPGLASNFGSGFVSPMSVAMDAAGDRFIADSGNNAILEFTPGSSTPIDIGTGLSQPGGVAVDGAGDVIIADTGNNRILEVPMVNGALSNSSQMALSTTLAGEALKSPSGVAVDGAGNLFIADTGNNRVVAVPYDGSWNVSGATTLGSSLTAPLAVAPDQSGNVYLADSGAGQIYKILHPFNQPSQQLVAVGFGNPSGLAVDASGSLFVADPANGEVVRIPNVSGNLDSNAAIQAGIGINAPYGIAMDPSGNLYISDSGAAAVYEVARTNITLAFGNWAVNTASGVLSAEIENEGNAPLTLGTPWYGSTGNSGDFSVASTGSGNCSSGATVAVGDSCSLDATFTPTADGARSATLTLASNAARASSAQVVLTGTGGTGTATTTALVISSPTAGAPFFGQPITFSVTVAATSGSPTGSVTLIVDGAQVATTTLNSSGTAKFNLASGLTGGMHSVVAEYAGSSTFSGSNSTQLQIAVTKAPTVTALTLTTPFTDPFSDLTGNSVTLTAAVQSTGVGIPTGGVNFTSNGTSLGTAQVLPASGGVFAATLSTTALAAGSDAIVASYSGDANYLSSTSAPTTITVVASAEVTLTPDSTSITVSKTSSGSINFTPTSYGGWTGLIGFGCDASSLPANARCVFSPGQTQVMASTSASPQQNLSVSLSIAIDQPPQTPTASGLFWWLAGPIGVLLLLTRRRFARRSWAWMAQVVAIVLLGISGLGLVSCSSGSPQNVTPSGTSTITVYAWADPFATAPSSSNATPATVACPANNPASAPCSQQTFQVSVTVQ